LCVLGKTLPLSYLPAPEKINFYKTVYFIHHIISACKWYFKIINETSYVHYSVHTNSSKSKEYFALTARLSLDQPHIIHLLLHRPLQAGTRGEATKQHLVRWLAAPDRPVTMRLLESVLGSWENQVKEERLPWLMVSEVSVHGPLAPSWACGVSTW
jgi:hypothetical protein